MNRSLIVAAVALAGLAACGKHAPTDAELVALLHGDGPAKGAEASRPLDAIAVQCLSVHSGDPALTHDLPSAALSAAAKTQCRTRLDLWLADSARNPGHFKFDEISTPAVARQALKLYLANGGQPFTQPSTDTANVSPPPAPAPVPVRAPEGPAPDINVAISQADNTCKDIKATIAKGPFNPRLQRYADSCESDLQITRDAVERFRQQGRQADVDATARRLTKMSESGQALLGHSNGS